MRTSRLTKWLIAAGLLLAIGTALVVIANRRLEPWLRERAEDAIRQRFAGDVELKSFAVTVFPEVIATGRGLTVRHHGRTDVPPLIAIDTFAIHTRLGDVFATPKRVRRLRLEGLRIFVPMGQASPSPQNGSKSSNFPFVVDEVSADGTLLQILPRTPGKKPITIDLHKLALKTEGIGRPMSFRATLTNPKPPGLIDTTGEFGPWNRDEPSQTPVSGSYTFKNADLSVFKGISGKLYSEGKYHGSVGHIETEGFTDTPDFTITLSGNPVHLKADFQAVVDGDDGDTHLKMVTARFLRSTIQARGAVAGKSGERGKTVALDVNIPKARLEDLLRLTTKPAKPFMTGIANVRTKLVIPPGDRDVMDKLFLDGEFSVLAGKFHDVKVQEKVDVLSHRARGRTERAPDLDDVASDLKGWFQLKNGVMTFSRLSFGVPGAFIRLQGTFGLRDETLDFHGTARTDAKVSQMTTGYKSVLLRAVDPFFKKGKAGAVIPIKVIGSREHPEFGLELRRK